MKKTMKFLLISFLIVISVLLVAAPAMAAPMDGESEVIAPAVNEFFTLGWLGSISGVVAAVSIMVQITKYMLPLNLNPKYYCLIWSAVFTMARLLWVVPPSSPADWFAGLINLFLIAVAATGTYEYAIKPLQGSLLKVPGTNTNSGSSGDAQ